MNTAEKVRRRREIAYRRWKYTAGSGAPHDKAWGWLVGWDKLHHKAQMSPPQQLHRLTLEASK